MRNIIGGQHEINENIYSLSLVRKKDKDHAYLILEGVINGARVTMDAHLVVKEGTNDKKAAIVYRDISVEKLTEVGQECHSWTWSITRNQAEAFIALVRAEQERGEQNKLDYTLFGKTATGGSIGYSLQQSGATSIQHSLEEYKNKFPTNIASQMSAVSLDNLLRSGHNCGSWAEAMVKAMQLPTPLQWNHFIAVMPKLDVRGTHNADEEPTTKCSLM